MRTEYNLKGGRPNPYAKSIGTKGLERFLRIEHFVKVDDDLIAAFPDEATLNKTLRLALEMKNVQAGL